MQKTKTSPDTYLASIPEVHQEDIKKLDELISAVMKGETRVMWEGTFWPGSTQNIIGYGDYSYEQPTGTVEWFKVGLALQKNFISIYINAVEDRTYLTEKYKERLGNVKVGKSSIGFNSLSDINLEVLEELLM